MRTNKKGAVLVSVIIHDYDSSWNNMDAHRMKMSERDAMLECAAVKKIMISDGHIQSEMSKRGTMLAFVITVIPHGYAE